MAPFFYRKEKNYANDYVRARCKKLKEENEELRIRLFRDERNIKKIVTQLDRLTDLVVMMAERR